jgi:hypothetical protein
MRTTTEATKAAIASLSAKPTKPAWLKLALYDALRDKPMSLQRERRMCAALGIEAPPPEYSVPACPGCGGEPHVAREGCHGNGGPVVVLEPGQRVTRARPPRQYTRIADMPTSMLARAIRERQAVPAPGVEVT